ncbi:MAG: rcsF protein [Colwellia sp.]|nr:rcsF protein [Colwellia sp.]
MKTYYKRHISQANLKVLLVSAVIALTGCSAHYTLSTNLDKENFKSYFSPGQVKIVTSENDLTGRYKLIGLVEGQDCQAKPHHAKPDKIAARTQARRQAFEQKSNAVIFTGCALITDDQASKQCHATIVCYAKAYQVEQVTD